MLAVDKIPAHARKVVGQANKSGALDRGEFTMAAARRAVCESLGLEEGALDGNEEKKAVKQAVKDAIAALQDDDEDDAEEEAVRPKRRAPKVKTAAPQASPKAKSPVPRAKASNPKKKAAKPDPDDDDDSDDGITDSGDESGDDEGDYHDDGQDPGPSVDSEAEDGNVASEDEKPTRKEADKRAPAAKKSRASAAAEPNKRVVSEEEVPNSDDEGAGPKRSVKRKERDESEAPNSGASSPLSSVYDEPPAKRRESGGKKATAGSAKGKKAKDATAQPSSDEARVAELKKIVVACGVRKQWTKEFTDYPTPRSQVSHLLSLLQSLGMKGTPTLGKAKALKQRRELAAELDEVKQFEAARGVSSDTGRTRRAAAGRPKYTEDPASGDDEGEEDEDSKGSATADVMAFLGDEDSDESD